MRVTAVPLAESFDGRASYILIYANYQQVMAPPLQPLPTEARSVTDTAYAL